MTDLDQRPVDVQAAPAQQLRPVTSTPPPPVRFTSQDALGGSASQLDAIQLAEMASRLGARGAEIGAVAAILQSLQAASIQVWMTHLPSFLAKINEWERAKLNRIMTAIQQLPEAAPPPGLFARMSAPVGQVQSVVSRSAVQQIIAQAMAENPPTQ